MSPFCLDLNVWQCALHAFRGGEAELAVHVYTVLAERRKPPLSEVAHFFLSYEIRSLHLKGSLGGLAVWHLPSAWGMVLESRDRVLHRAPCMEPASPLCLCLCVCVCVCVCVSHE